MDDKGWVVQHRSKPLSDGRIMAGRHAASIEEFK
jgi:hypothetical protein